MLSVLTPLNMLSVLTPLSDLMRLSFSYYTLPETIKRKIFIFMVPTVYIFREGQPDPDKVETVEEYKTTQTIKLPECVICYHNPPNILYYNCLHIAVCNSCDQSGKLLNCPLCRTKIKDQRIKI